MRHGFCWTDSGLKNFAPKELINAFSSKRLVGALQLGVFLLVLAMTHFESLHHLFHADANQPNHHCAVTLLSGGQLDAPPSCSSTIVHSPIVVVVQAIHQPVIFISFDFALLPSCGPPAVLS
jgi:hypothetical protein